MRRLSLPFQTSGHVPNSIILFVMPVLKIIYISLSTLILGAIAALGIMTLRFDRAFRDTSHLVHHTIDVLDETQNSLTGLHSLQTGNPGILLLPHIYALRLLTADNPQQQLRVDSLFHFYGKAAAASPLPPANLPVIRSYPDSIREGLLRMQVVEHRMLDIREAANAASLHMLQRTIITLLIAIISLVCISFSIIIYHLKRRLKAEKKLQDAEQQFTLLVQREKNYAIFMLDTNGNVKTWNEGACRIKGYSAAEIVGRPISLFYTAEGIAQNEPALNLQRPSSTASMKPAD